MKPALRRQKSAARRRTIVVHRPPALDAQINVTPLVDVPCDDISLSVTIATPSAEADFRSYHRKPGVPQRRRRVLQKTVFVGDHFRPRRETLA